MSDHDDEKRGANAQALLDDPLLAKALEESKRQVLEMWENTPSRDKDGREWLWMLHQATLRVENILKGYIDNGRIAKANLKEGKTITERLRSVL